ncbi:713_t:CDS:2 [Entrophospora sp. SA101]|nr:713_t:CDS:2 [Entrophospora sp. SA101]
MNPNNNIVLNQDSLDVIFKSTIKTPFYNHNSGGGGERVLWTTIHSIQEKYLNVICVVYTGDVDVTKKEILSKVLERFNIEIKSEIVEFIFLHKREYPRFTLLGQSIGSMVLGYEALNKLTPDIYFDTMGYAFTYPIAKKLFGSEAAAIHCMNKLNELNLKTGAKYLVVDCGGGTVDLTVRKLLSDDRIAETTERSGDFCGGTYVDDEFLKFLESRVGKSAMNMLKEKHYGQVNYLIHKYFCPVIKIPFTGEKSKFKDIELDIQRKCPAIMQYVTGSEREQLSDEDEWIIDFDFDTVKSFFDPVINKILRLIEIQLSKCPDCSVMFLVGGFTASAKI